MSKKKAEKTTKTAKTESNGHVFAIEKGVAVPARTRRGKYPFDRMAVNDSFFVPDLSVGSIRSTASTAAKRLECKFIVREVDGGCRVWRVE